MENKMSKKITLIESLKKDKSLIEKILMKESDESEYGNSDVDADIDELMDYMQELDEDDMYKLETSLEKAIGQRISGDEQIASALLTIRQKNPKKFEKLKTWVENRLY